MPLQPISQMMHHAQEAGYAVGYFESWNLESLQGVVDAAEATRSPVILGFNGDFLSRSRNAEERLALYGALGLAAAVSSTVPCGLIFNECPRDDWVRQAIELGFNLIMLADPEAPHAKMVERVAAFARLAHAHDVAIEGEVGELPMGSSASRASSHGGRLTDPNDAAAFVEQTGVDLLAVSVGNVHIQLDGKCELDLERLAQIAGRVSVPLVLHGGSGIDPTSLRDAVKLGVTKVNFGTYLKQRYLWTIERYLAPGGSVEGRAVANPHQKLGLGGPEDILVAARLAVKEAVLERLDQLGCPGRADDRRMNT
jgi:ketose-bisphosphate aldolase